MGSELRFSHLWGEWCDGFLDFECSSRLVLTHMIHSVCWVLCPEYDKCHTAIFFSRTLVLCGIPIVLFCMAQFFVSFSLGLAYQPQQLQWYVHLDGVFFFLFQNLSLSFVLLSRRSVTWVYGHLLFLPSAWHLLFTYRVDGNKVDSGRGCVKSVCVCVCIFSWTLPRPLSFIHTSVFKTFNL